MAYETLSLEPTEYLIYANCVRGQVPKENKKGKDKRQLRFVLVSIIAVLVRFSL